jgi:hypothetical protein
MSFIRWALPIVDMSRPFRAFFNQCFLFDWRCPSLICFALSGLFDITREQGLRQLISNIPVNPKFKWDKYS